MSPSPRIWLTRPAEDSALMAKDFAEDGITTLSAPLLHIEPCDVVLSATAPAAILLTSRHAAHALPMEWAHLPIYCVGTATGDAARVRGYRTIICSESDVLALLPQMASELCGKSLLYLSGEDVSVDVGALVGKHDVVVERVIAYRAVAATQLSDALREALADGALTGVVFFSARTATIARELIAREHLMDATRMVDAYCLSLAVANAAGQLPWRALHVAHTPTRKSMLTMICAHAARIDSLPQV